MPKNVGREGFRWGRADTVEVAHTGKGGKIHLQFGEHLDEEDLWSLNMPDSVDTKVSRQPVKVLGWKLK